MSWCIIVLVHVSIVVEIMVLIIAKNPMTKLVLCGRRGVQRKGTVGQVMVAVVEGVLVMAGTNKAVETMNRISLEYEILLALLIMKFTVLMRFGWLLWQM